MPRSSAAKKQTANQHNPRHENGLAAPGKRIVKERSNGHLNGSTIGKTQPSTPPLPSPVLTAQSMTLQHASEIVANGLAGEGRMGCVGKLAQDTSVRRYSEGSSEGFDECQSGTNTANVMEEQPHRRIDVNASKNPAVHDGGAISLASTILRSCPLGDTIAILIILLQIPPTFLTIVHFLFVTLTFVPPSGTTIASIPTVADFFASSSGTPSLATVAIADVVFLIFWLFLWAPAQNFALDLSQAVIAVSLGGGYSGRNGGSTSAIMCTALITTSHVMRRTGFQQSGLRYVWSPRPLSKSGSVKSIPSLPDFQDSSNTTYGWIRSILAVHILTQGVVRILRRWISRREMIQPSSPAKKTDPEALVGAQIQADSSIATDSSSTTTNGSTTDGQATSTSANVRNTKERASSGKKKRKQGNHVRGQQPLWAALASTKIIVLKEYEQSKIKEESAGVEGSDINNLGSAPFDQEEGRIWITYVGSSDVCFHTSYFDSPDEDNLDCSNAHVLSTPGINKAKPFYVRINGANWSSTRICKPQFADSAEESKEQWTGEIFGLTPLTPYWCEFVRSEDDVVLYSTSITTQPAPTAESCKPTLTDSLGDALKLTLLATSVSSTPLHQSLRPSSPTTTLKNSILASENNINESRARLKRTRKDHKTTISALKREIDSFNSRLASSGNGDDRQRQRVLQITQLIRQAEDSTAAIAAQIESMGVIPEEDVQDWRDKKEAWEVARRCESRARNGLSDARTEANRQISNIESEKQTVQQKRDRLQGRHNKLIEQHDRITSANAQGLDEQERKAAEHAAKEAERQAMQQQYIDEINYFQRQIQENQSCSHQAWQQLHQVEAAYTQQHPSSQPLSSHHSPITPEGNLPGTVPSSSILSANHRSPSFVFPTFGVAPSSSLNTQPLNSEGRGRSSSMLSCISGFTDFYEADSLRPLPTDLTQDSAHEEEFEAGQRSDRSGSGSGSGSGSASGSGSQRDPISPRPTQISPVGAIGDGSPKWR
ncbi:MAG: hypothetical protein M1827_000933 [Pycnora praestabilis]|nr:MAG: hypothetical protein M1827_000933 [Pycnora praestabilis]